MARQRESHIRRQITSLISPQLIRRRGRDLGVVQRHRKVDIVAFVYTLVLGFATSRRRSLAGLRRAYTGNRDYVGVIGFSGPFHPGTSRVDETAH